MSVPVRVYRAAWVLPVATPPIHRGELLVDEQGRIAAVAPAGALDLPAEVEIIDLGEAILLPGLVNVHAHPELTLFRGALEGLPFREWILRLVAGKRKALIEGDEAIAARWTMAEAVRAGITTLAATEASGASVEALREAGLRGIVFQEVFGPDPAQEAVAIENLYAQLEAISGAAGGRVHVGVSPHAPYTISDELYRATARLALEAKLPMAVHIAESQAERELVVSGAGDFAPGLRLRGIATPPRGRSPIDLLERLGVLEVKPLLIHCVDIDRADLEAIVSFDCPVAHCPIANAKLGHGIAPLDAMRQAGVRVGLGTDSVASNNRLDLFEEARFAALLQRALERDPALFPADELLRLCTVEGARALGLADTIGTLEPGKEADLCAVGLSAPALLPLFDPVTALFHSARASDVVLTVVGGQVLYREGRYLTLDPAAMRPRLEEAANRLREHA